MRLIDADELTEMVWRERLDTRERIANLIARQPTINGIVKHGRWIDCTFYDPCEKSWEQNYEFRCNNCGHKIENKPNDGNMFCGHCGARMNLKDGEREHEN